jgi:hypothetical protein
VIEIGWFGLPLSMWSVRVELGMGGMVVALSF